MIAGGRAPVSCGTCWSTVVTPSRSPMVRTVAARAAPGADAIAAATTAPAAHDSRIDARLLATHAPSCNVPLGLGGLGCSGPCARRQERVECGDQAEPPGERPRRTGVASDLPADLVVVD